MKDCKPIFIVIEGPDRVGKKTQSTMLYEALMRRGKNTELVEVPWNGNFTYDAIYYMLEHGLASKFPNLFQIIQNINKLSCQRINKNRFERRDYVIFDRWRLSTLAYGGATGANLKVTKMMYDKMLSPDLTILLLGKKLTQTSDDEYEKSSDIQTFVRYFYANEARKYEDNCIAINVDGMSREEIHQIIIETMIKMGLLTGDAR